MQDAGCQDKVIILLVEDENDDCVLFRLALAQAGLTHVLLKTVEDGDQAVRYLKGEGPFSDRALSPLPDLIVLDLKMPRMSGEEFLKWQKHSSGLSTIPVVVLAEASNKAQTQVALDAGARACFPKECNFEQWMKMAAEVVSLGLESKRRG